MHSTVMQGWEGDEARCRCETRINKLKSTEHAEKAWWREKCSALSHAYSVLCYNLKKAGVIDK